MNVTKLILSTAVMSCLLPTAPNELLPPVTTGQPCVRECEERLAAINNGQARIITSPKEIWP